jgi:hypothetical protein
LNGKYQGFDISHEYYLWQYLSVVTKHITLWSWPRCFIYFKKKNFNLGYNFWMVCTRALIFHMSILCDKTFSWVQNFWTCVILTLVFNLFIENFNLAYIFWLVITRTLIFHTSLPWDKTLPWDQQIWHYDLDLDVWPTYWKFYLWL